MQRVGHAHGQYAGEQQRPPAVQKIPHVHRLRQGHEGSGQHRHHQGLNAVEPQPVQTNRKAVNAGNLHRKGQGASHEQQIPPVDLPGAHAAEQIKSRNRQSYADKGGFGHLLSQKQPQDGHQHNVHGGNESGFSRIGVHKSHLLQAGGHKQRSAADQAGFPQRGILPLFQRPSKAALAQLHGEAAHHQENHCQQTTDHLKGKRPDEIHAHTLSDKGKSPDNGCQEQAGAAPNFRFHCCITGEYCSIIPGKMQGTLLFHCRVV